MAWLFWLFSCDNLRRQVQTPHRSRPARAAREQRWPIRLDHCFKRICLDHAFADVWYKHLAKPAERNLQGEPLTRSIRCAEELLAQGLPLLQKRNTASLCYRGKLRRET